MAAAGDTDVTSAPQVPERADSGTNQRGNETPFPCPALAALIQTILKRDDLYLHCRHLHCCRRATESLV
jgi:hypothetical protein